MIRVRRPKAAPTVLQGRGHKACNDLCRAVSSTPAKKRAALNLQFHAAIYRHATVKRSLAKAHHGKCCYCEWRVDRCDIEHYRPKAAVRQDERSPLEYPGYYWLAYEWTNLLYACPFCNTDHKANHFPLADPRKRARSHRARLSAERPLLIDPAADAPEALIGFREEVPFPIHNDPRARATIHRLCLDNHDHSRDGLEEDRRTRLKLIRAYQALLKCGTPQEKAEAHDFLHEAVLDHAPFASMARWALGLHSPSPHATPARKRRPPSPSD